MLRLGILGAGTIGHRVARACISGELPYTLTAILDNNTENAKRITVTAPSAQPVTEIEKLVGSCDVVLEAASTRVVEPLVRVSRVAAKDSERLRQKAEEAVGGGFISSLFLFYAGNLKKKYERTKPASHLVIMSVGGLLDVPDLHADGPTIHVPSGALGGLDAVQALAVAGLDEVTLTTRKPPAGLGLKSTGEDACAAETVLFEGSAREVIARYPKNVNVAVALSLAGIGPDRTRCRLIADPAIERNTHHVYARGPAGEIEFTSRNVPSPDNPATSYLAALSAIALLKKLASKLQVG